MAYIVHIVKQKLYSTFLGHCSSLYFGKCSKRKLNVIRRQHFDRWSETVQTLFWDLHAARLTCNLDLLGWWCLSLLLGGSACAKINAS